MMFVSARAWTLFLFLGLLEAQTSSIDPRRCLAGSGVTGFPACDYVSSVFSTCSAFAAASSASAYFNCFCDQKYLNALFDCDSEERLCLGNGEEVDVRLSDQVSVWHSGCDDKVNYSPTTPAVSTISSSFEISYCRTVKSNCESLTVDRESCTESFQDSTDAASLTACLCAPPLLTLAYDCSILGNVSCIQVPGALSGMAEYGHCPNLNQYLTVPPSLNAPPIGPGTTIRATYYTPPSSTRAQTTPTLSPGATPPPSPSPTVTQNAAAQLSMLQTWTWVCTLGLLALASVLIQLG